MMDDDKHSQIEPLLNHFQNLMPLRDEEKRLVRELFTPRLYRKRQYVHQAGDICSSCNFVVRGCLRMYKADSSGNVHIIQFASEQGWIMDIGSFHERTASELDIDAIEDTMVLQISYENLLNLYTNEPKFDRIFRVLMENSYVSLQKRLLQTISTDAEERYKSFLITYPHLANRLPQTQIASFLGITPEFLSRLRSRHAKHGS